MKKYFKYFVLTTAFCLILTMQTSSEAKTKYISLGSSSASSGHYAYSVAAAKAINEYVGDVKVSVVETGASVDNLKRLRAGQLDLGIGGMQTMYEAWKGLGGWGKNPYPDLRILWAYAKTIDFIVVREDSGITKLEDLSGKKFSPGIRGSATESATKQIFNVLGIEPDYYIGGASDAVGAIKDNRIVGYVKTGVGTQLDSTTLDIMTLTKIRLISMTEKQIEKIKKELPYVSIITIPAGQLAAMPKQPEYSNWGMTTVVECLKTFPEDLAYKFVKAIVKGKKYQDDAYPACKHIDIVQETPLLISVPLHAGAIKAYRELGAKNIPLKILPPEVK
ncbi:MAG: TAXI family TRAP transporter solute-binding subunit [Methanosarcinaceae archaeon]|nr:TAXI family TRAP transporter solute-binding subunit [Methanosarcinaceae archaeon]